MPPPCTEQVPDQKEQVAAFVSTNIRRNDKLLVDSIEDKASHEPNFYKWSDLQIFCLEAIEYSDIGN